MLERESVLLVTNYLPFCTYNSLLLAIEPYFLSICCCLLSAHNEYKSSLFEVLNILIKRGIIILKRHLLLVIWVSKTCATVYLWGSLLITANQLSFDTCNLILLLFELILLCYRFYLLVAQKFHVRYILKINKQQK